MTRLGRDRQNTFELAGEFDLGVGRISGHVSPAWLVGQAQRFLVAEYMRTNPGADRAAVEENARLASVGSALDVLRDFGITVTEAAEEQIRDLECAERAGLDNSAVSVRG